MSKLLFTHAYLMQLDPKQWKIGQPYAPLATLYAASFLRSKGYDVSFFDTMFSAAPTELIAALESNQPDFLIIYDDGFNYLTKMCLSNMREAAFEMIRLGKERDCTVILSSSDATDHYQAYLEAGADYIVLGEAELTLNELLDSLNASAAELQAIKGIAYRSGDEFIKNASRPVLQHLDSLPFPAWDLLDIEPYRKMWKKSSRYFSLNLSTTRGCPYKCNWCAKPIYGNRYNTRSPENVVAEIKLLKTRYDFDHIWFCDDIFGLKPEWVRRFSELIQSEGIRIRFKIQSRADLLAKEEYVRHLSLAGCETIWMGAESGSQRILDAMDKGITLNEIAIATDMIRKHGMRPCFFIQFGYLGETRQDIDQTIAMIKKLMPSELGISVSYPLPGTRFYDKVKADLQAKANWTDSDELYLMFQNTYSPMFYKQLHRYVHSVYRQKLGWVKFRTVIKQPHVFRLRDVRKIFNASWYLPKIWMQGRQLKKLI